MTDELKTLRERAARHGRKGSYGRDAVALNERILALDPADATALLRLIRCHEEAGDWLSAHECYAELLALGVGDEGRIRAKLEETHERAAAQIPARREAEARERDRQAREAERQRKLIEDAQAIDSFRDARSLAIAAREAKEYDTAIAYHDRSVDLARSVGDKTGALAAKASTLRRAERPEEAHSALRASIALDPSRETNKPSYTSLVAVLRELDELDDARQEGEALLERYPNDSFVLFALGRVLKDLARRDRDPAMLERAQRCYRRAEELQPGDRNIVAELRSLISLYDELARQLQQPELRPRLVSSSATSRGSSPASRTAHPPSRGAIRRRCAGHGQRA